MLGKKFMPQALGVAHNSVLLLEAPEELGFSSLRRGLSLSEKAVYFPRHISLTYPCLLLLLLCFTPSPQVQEKPVLFSAQKTLQSP